MTPLFLHFGLDFLFAGSILVLLFYTLVEVYTIFGMVSQKFESAFYSNPDLRNVRPPQEPEQPQQTLDLAALIEQLQKSPELANTLAALLAGQKAS